MIISYKGKYENRREGSTMGSTQVQFEKCKVPHKMHEKIMETSAKVK
jgi:hypothetical protein